MQSWPAGGSRHKRVAASKHRRPDRPARDSVDAFENHAPWQRSSGPSLKFLPFAEKDGKYI